MNFLIVLDVIKIVVYIREGDGFCVTVHEALKVAESLEHLEVVTDEPLTPYKIQIWPFIKLKDKTAGWHGIYLQAHLDIPFFFD